MQHINDTKHNIARDTIAKEMCVYVIYVFNKIFTKFYFLYIKINSFDGWGITNLENRVIKIRKNMLSVNVQKDTVTNPDEAIYWVAPTTYLGNKVRLSEQVVKQENMSFEFFG